MKLIKLSMVYRTRQESYGTDEYTREVELTKPVALDAEQVRNFYSRREPHTGTRILFRSGSALAVTESFEQVESAIRTA